MTQVARYLRPARVPGDLCGEADFPGLIRRPAAHAFGAALRARGVFLTLRARSRRCCSSLSFFEAGTDWVTGKGS